MTDWTFEDEYLELCHHVMTKGEDRADRTGTGTRAIFSATLNIDLSRGFPLITTKTVPFRSVATELLWFIEGSGDERRLAEILHGTRDPEKKTIWSPNAEGTTGSKFQPKYQGDLGRIYGVQWRDWQSTQVTGYSDFLQHHDGSGATTYFGAKALTTRVDQLAQIVDKLLNNPTDRRIILSAWNPGELDQMALPPCHMFAQFYLSNGRKLSCQMYQRSVDLALGLPFNIASYALLTHMLANTIKAEVGDLNMVLGDTHIYKDHFTQVEEQLTRKPRALPKLHLMADPGTSIDKYIMMDFGIDGYNPHPAIKMRMSA
jgi:thymidylate synthase